MTILYNKLSAVILIALSSVLILNLSTRVSAQQNSDQSDLPSDLSLDLEFAQKNPAPESEIINQAETKQATIVTPTSQVTVKPEEVLTPEVKTVPSNQVNHPSQTTSEQVIVTPVTVEKNNQAPGSSGSPVEVQPSIQPSGAVNNISPTNTNPASPVDTSTPSTSPASLNVNPTSATTSQPATAVPTKTSKPNPSNFVPGTTVVEPDDNMAPTEPPSAAPPPPPPTDNNPPPEPDDNSAVQGLSIGPNWWQRLFHFLTGK